MYRNELTDQIDRNAHYFVLLHPLEITLVPPYGAIVSTSNMTREKWVECVIDEERYKLDEGYKIELKSIEPGYGRENFYIEDFLSNLESGYRIVKKEPEMECVEVHWDEPLTPTVHVHHSAYTLKKVPNHKDRRSQ